MILLLLWRFSQFHSRKVFFKTGFGRLRGIESGKEIPPIFIVLQWS
jgi:hypothetical protein